MTFGVILKRESGEADKERRMEKNQGMKVESGKQK